MGVFSDHEGIKLVDLTGKTIGKVVDISAGANGGTVITAELSAPDPIIVTAGLKEVTPDELDLACWRGGVFKENADKVIQIISDNDFKIMRAEL